MGKSRRVRNLMCGAASAVLLASAGGAYAQEAKTFEIPAQPLVSALYQFGEQSGRQVLFKPSLADERMSSRVTQTQDQGVALAQLLQGTGLTFRRSGDVYLIEQESGGPQSGSAVGDGAEVEALIVTAQKREEDIQDVPIAISAFSQENLERSQVAGGPDLITQVPNMSFTKTNFSSYSVQIRGIGTQAISATTDPAVAVAMNNTPFIRNRFFEQEFYDLQRLEVLRGPQGTLYGRNATAGVVNLITHKPVFGFESKLSADLSNYNSSRLEGMLNVPLVEDKVALRLAAAWTKRDGYATNQMTGQQIDGRDLWSARASLRFEPTDWLSANLIYEHFQEDDDRLRSGKQLCKKHVVTEVGGIPVTTTQGGVFGINTYVSQGCLPVSLYSDEAFQTPNGYALPYYGPTLEIGGPVSLNRDPYVSAFQSRDLRVIESSVEPDYQAKTDIAELQIAIDISPTLTLSSETAFNEDSVWSLQDFNRFTTVEQAWVPAFPGDPRITADGEFCDPQLGCSDRLLLVDLSTSESTQFSQELRLASDTDSPLNFSLGANFLRHDALDKYYVFINSLTAVSSPRCVSSTCVATPDNSSTFPPGAVGDTAPVADPFRAYNVGGENGGFIYIDPNPIGALNDQGRNYFLSKNPYKLISYAMFGEVYYNVTDRLKITGGLRWTIDEKTAPQIPSWVLAQATAGPYPVAKTIVQEWQEPTGRLTVDWKPDLAFTDETLLYASLAHGYKAGGANPPPPVLVYYGATNVAQEILPDIFGPEFVNALELGAKNTLLDGQMTFNANAFYYDYTGYQTSEIRNRAAVNSNYDAKIWGAEIELDWRPLENLKLGFKGGYNGTRIADGERAIDLMDRTAGHEGWVVIRPFPTIPSNCIVPTSVLIATGQIKYEPFPSPCVEAYYQNLDPATHLPFAPNPTTDANGIALINYAGFDPSTAPNNGRGFDKELGGNELPNAPEFTATLTADYTLPLPYDWLVTLHGDYHYQGQSWGRVFNSDPYDRIEDFSIVNLAAIFTNEEAGWKVMAYVKNALDETAITGTFLNSDDTGLTTNVFLTEPRLYGLRVTKEWTGGPWWTGANPDHKGPYPFEVEIGGSINRFDADNEEYRPDWMDSYSDDFPLPGTQGRDIDWNGQKGVKLTYRPGSGPWQVSAGYRFGRTNAHHIGRGYEHVDGGYAIAVSGPFYLRQYNASPDNHLREAVRQREEHTLVDFMVGHDVGFGTLSPRVSSRLSAGMRYGEFVSAGRVQLDGIPDRVVPEEFFPFVPTFPQVTSNHYTTSLSSEREFEGYGPQVSWEAALRLWGDDEDGHADLDWSLSGGALFGKQRMSSEEDRLATHYVGGLATPETNTPATPTTLYDDVISRSREDEATAPFVGVSLGLSYEVRRVKVSTGYRYDRFFDVIDGGYREAATYDRTIHGPYLKLSLGFGG